MFPDCICQNIDIPAVINVQKNDFGFHSNQKTQGHASIEQLIFQISSLSNLIKTLEYLLPWTPLYLLNWTISLSSPPCILFFLPPDSYNFTILLQRCIPTVCGLLGSPSSTDVTQAVNFFVNAHNFGIKQAIVGIRKMLALIWSSDAAIKDAVTSAYRVRDRRRRKETHEGTTHKLAMSLGTDQFISYKD